MLAIKEFHALVLFLWVKYLAMFLANKPHIKAFIDDLCVQSHMFLSLCLRHKTEITSLNMRDLRHIRCFKIHLF